MACIQTCRSAEAYHGKHKSVVEEMCNKANHFVNKHCREHGDMTGDCIKNAAKGRFKFLNKHDWSSKNKEAYPHSISKCLSGTFLHTSTHCGSHSDEAALVYSDECDSAWILAWSVKDHWGGCSNPNKVPK